MFRLPQPSIITQHLAYMVEYIILIQLILDTLCDHLPDRGYRLQRHLRQNLLRSSALICLRRVPLLSLLPNIAPCLALPSDICPWFAFPSARPFNFSGAAAASPPPSSFASRSFIAS